MDLSVHTETFGQDDQTWLAASHGTDAGVSITLDVSAFTEATHFPDGYFPSGLPLGKVTASGLYGPYNDAAADGTNVLAGFLLTPVPTDGSTDCGGVLFQHGVVVQANLPIAINANGAADIAGRITLV